MRGIIHAHSEFSRDGLHSVGDLADFARECGFRFVGLTDHAEDLSAEDIQSLQQECIKCSDELFVMIPGLEFRCRDDIHILGIGVTEKIASTDPVTVARYIQGVDGLAVIAHPGRNGYQCSPDLFPVVNGIEIWNAAYDGRFVPPLANLRIFQEARGHNANISAFGGADLHWFEGPPGITVELPAKTDFPVTPERVMDYLRLGKFTIRGKYFVLDSRIVSHPMMHFALIMGRTCYDWAKAIRQTATGRPEGKGA